MLPPFTLGRAPRTSDEIALGATTLRELGLKVGDHVVVTNGGLRRSLHVTGQMVLNPSVVNDQVPFGHGALMTLGGLKTVHASAPVNVFLVRFVARSEPQHRVGQAEPRVPRYGARPAPPPDIENLRLVDNLPGPTDCRNRSTLVRYGERLSNFALRHCYDNGHACWSHVVASISVCLVASRILVARRTVELARSVTPIR